MRKGHDWSAGKPPREWMVEFSRWRRHWDDIQREHVRQPGGNAGQQDRISANRSECEFLVKKYEVLQHEYRMLLAAYQEKHRELMALSAECDAMREYLSNFRNQEIL